MKKTTFLPYPLSLLALALATPVHAEQSSTALALPALTVKATKREQTLQDIAGAADVATPDEILPRGLRRVDQLDRVFTDVHIRQRSSRAFDNFTIRGQSSPDFYNPAAQLLIDGLPQDQALLSQLLPQGLEQVEILYGPQGTLYGRGAVGTSDNRGELKDMYTGSRLGDNDDSNGRVRLRYAPDGSPQNIDFSYSPQEARNYEVGSGCLMKSDWLSSHLVWF